LKKDLRRKAEYFVSILRRLPPISPEILLIYESQRAGKEIGVIKVLFDEKWIEDKIKYAREYWGGKRGALKFQRRINGNAGIASLANIAFNWSFRKVFLENFSNSSVDICQGVLKFMNFIRTEL